MFITEIQFSNPEDGSSTSFQNIETFNQCMLQDHKNRPLSETQLLGISVLSFLSTCPKSTKTESCDSQSETADPHNSLTTTHSELHIPFFLCYPVHLCHLSSNVISRKDSFLHCFYILLNGHGNGR